MTALPAVAAAGRPDRPGPSPARWGAAVAAGLPAATGLALTWWAGSPAPLAAVALAVAATLGAVLLAGAGQTRSGLLLGGVPLLVAAAAHRPMSPWLAGALLAGAVLATAAAAGAAPARPGHRHLVAAADRARHQLAGAAVAATGALAGAEAVLRLVTGLEPVPRAGLVLAAATLPLAVAAGGLPAGRRRAGAAVTAAAAVAALAGALVVAAALAVVVLGWLPDGRARAPFGAAMLGAAAAALAFPPLLRRASALGRRVVAPARTAPEQVLQTFTERANRGTPVPELLRQLAESLRRAAAAASVEVWSGDGERLGRGVAVPDAPPVPALTGRDLEVLARTGVAGPGWLRLWLPRLLPEAGGSVRVAPAVAAGAVLGLVVVRRPPDAEPFTEADDRALAEVADRLAAVLHTRRLDSALRVTLEDLQRTNTELRASRARLVAAADAERRRIERDLHDGAQQHLVALAVTLGLARDVLAEDPAAAGELLEEMVTDVRDTVRQLRDLAHGIYPALLKESGLAEALRAAAARSPVPVRVTAADAGRHPPEVEAAVYFCCLEALQNVAKHAATATVDLRVWRDDTALHFAVVDDGPGYDPAAAGSGHGFQNMADRLGAVGGAVRWEGRPGAGARVVGSVPAPRRG